MQRIPRIVLILLCAIAMQFLSAMSGCECPETTMRMTRIGASISPFDNSGSSPAVRTETRFPARAFGLSFTIGWKDSIAAKLAHGMGAGVAWATPPCDPVTHYILTDTVRLVRLLRQDAGGAIDDVGKDFVLARLGIDPEGIFRSIQAFDALTDIVNREAAHFYGTAFLLRENFASMRGENIRFIIHVELTNGNILADTTDQLELY